MQTGTFQIEEVAQDPEKAANNYHLDVNQIYFTELSAGSNSDVVLKRGQQPVQDQQANFLSVNELDKASDQHQYVSPPSRTSQLRPCSSSASSTFQPQVSLSKTAISVMDTYHKLAHMINTCIIQSDFRQVNFYSKDDIMI